MAETLIRQEEIDSLGRKLEKLSQELTDEERTLLLAMISLAKKGIEEQVEESEVVGFGAGAGGLVVTSGGAMPSVSSAFGGAFASGGSSGMGSTRGVHGEGGITGGSGGITGTIKIVF